MYNVDNIVLYSNSAPNIVVISIILELLKSILAMLLLSLQ